MPKEEILRGFINKAYSWLPVKGKVVLDVGGKHM